MKKIKSILLKVWNNKIFRTFFQTFIGTFATGYVMGMDDKELLTLLSASISAGICAIMNVGKYESC